MARNNQLSRIRHLVPRAVEGPLRPRERHSGPILHPGYEHLTWRVTVEKIEPEHFFSFRWRPHAIDPNKDYSNEPTTLVTFELTKYREARY